VNDTPKSSGSMVTRGAELARFSPETNFNSGPQLREYLFGTLKFAPPTDVRGAANHHSQGGRLVLQKELSRVSGLGPESREVSLRLTLELVDSIRS
jgi:hypothetical protein